MIRARSTVCQAKSRPKHRIPHKKRSAATKRIRGCESVRARRESFCISAPLNEERATELTNAQLKGAAANLWLTPEGVHV